jgi:hypothetical protein
LISIMTGVVDRYAVIAEHLHYNPSFDVDSEDARIARGVSVHAGRDGYLDILSNSDPEAERERSESRMAEETVPTSEIVFETGGKWQQRNRLSQINVVEADAASGNGVYSLSLGWTDNDGNPGPSFFQNAAVVKNCSFVSSKCSRYSGASVAMAAALVTGCSFCCACCCRV